MRWDVLRASGALTGLDVSVLGPVAALYERYAVFNRLHDQLVQAQQQGTDDVVKRIAASMHTCLVAVEDKQAAA